jgi:SAM-dependent methyltransferase
MSISKAWEWSKEKNPVWLTPSEESYYLAERWKTHGYCELLDFGCGLGRHSIFFAQKGFKVSAFDLSAEGAQHLKQWSEDKQLKINVEVADMLSLPYPDASFDCIFAYHVISHTDSRGIVKIISEMMRVLKKSGEFYLTLCSKEAWGYREAGYPRLDDNTVIKTDDGPEKDVPHFFASREDILALFKNQTILKIRHIDDCYFDGHCHEGKHFFVLGQA